MSNPREVVITGLGIVSPLGIGRHEFTAALDQGRSGVRRIEQFEPSALPVRFAGEIPDFQAKLYVKPRKSLKVMSREIQLGVASAALAIEDAALDVDDMDSERLGVVYGSEMLYSDPFELQDLYAKCRTDDNQFAFADFGQRSQADLFPLWMLKYLPNMTASHVGIACDARGPNNSIILGDVSSLVALIEATTVIERGLCDVMLTGGSGSRMSITPWMYRGDVNMSHREENPAAASRPFDADRDGMVIGEGSCTLVLESRAHAVARGANILGQVAGYAIAHCGSDFSSPGRQKAIRSTIKQSLRRADMESDMLSHIQADGLSTVAEDAIEAQAIAAELPDVPVTAAKSYFGNLGAGTGAVELAASLVDKERGRISPTLNYETPDTDCPIDVVARPRLSAKPAFLALNQARTGQAVAVAIL